MNRLTKGEKAGVIAGTGTAVVGTAITVGGVPLTTTLVRVFGTASTGAAISSLSGATATTATLATVGGGAIAAGGGGMAAGIAILTAMGPVGLGLAALGAVTAGVILRRKKKNRH